MRKKMCASLGMVIGLGLLAGCGTSFDANNSTLYIDDKGRVTALDVEEFDQDYYDETELGSYVQKAVDEYAKEHGKNAVKVEDLTVEGTTAKLQMKYKSVEDYANFNGIELCQGKVVATLAAGYTYDGDFVKVSDGKVTGNATKQEIYQDEDLKAVIIRANTDVKVDGEICYVSSENVKLTGTDSVSIREGYSLSNQESNESVMSTELTETPDEGAFETDVYTYIIYK